MCVLRTDPWIAKLEVAGNGQAVFPKAEAHLAADFLHCTRGVFFFVFVGGVVDTRWLVEFFPKLCFSSLTFEERGLRAAA